VSAFDAEELQAGNWYRMDDLAVAVPNLVIRENTGLSNGATIFMRGVGEDDSRIGSDPAVGIYIDDQYYGRQLGGMLDLVEIERVEVLRGPQGTLYGRNVNGGAVKIYTKKPSEEPEIQFSGSFGNFGRTEGLVRGSTALSEQLRVSAAYSYKIRDGFWEGSGVSEDDLGEVDKGQFLFSSQWISDDGLEVLFRVDRSQDDSDPNFTNPSGLDQFWKLTTGGVVQAAGSGNPAIDEDNLKSETTISGSTLHLSGRLGDWDLKSITGWRKTENELLTAIGFYYLQEVEYTSFSQELQLSSTGNGGLDWLLGFYYYAEDSEQDTFFWIVPSVLEIETASIAVYGSLSSRFGADRKWGGSLGLRLSNEEKDAEGAATTFGSQQVTLDDSEDDSLTDFRLVLDYLLTEDVMLYGSVTTGSKSFGWSSDDLGLVDTEEVVTWEAGLRAQSPDRRMRLNVTAFFNDYTDLQINGTTASSAFSRTNAGDVETVGLEVEASYALTPALRLDLMIGRQEGEYKSLDASVLRAFLASSVAEAEDRELKNLPQQSMRLAIQYQVPMMAGLLQATASYGWTSDYFTLLQNAKYSVHEATGLVDLRLAWNAGNDSWWWAVWGKNVTDEEYVSAATGNEQIPGAPATFGFDVGFRFF